MSDTHQSPGKQFNTLDFASVQVRDLEASRQYYTEVLGFEVSPEGPPHAVVFKNDAGAIFAIRTPLTDLGSAPKLGLGASFWFAVPDADDLHDRVVEKGGTIAMPIQDGPFGRMFVVIDPDGYSLTFHQA